MKPQELRIYCKYCGAMLKHDTIGKHCPTKNCQWRYGLPEDEPGALNEEEDVEEER